MTDTPGRDGWGTWPQHDPPGGPPDAEPGTPAGTDSPTAPPPPGSPDAPAAPYAPKAARTRDSRRSRRPDAERTRRSDAERRGLDERAEPVQFGSLLSAETDAPTGRLPYLYNPPSAFDAATAPPLKIDLPRGAHRPQSTSPRRLPPGPRLDTPTVAIPAHAPSQLPDHPLDVNTPMLPALWSPAAPLSEFDPPDFDLARHGEPERTGVSDIGASGGLGLDTLWADTPELGLRGHDTPWAPSALDAPALDTSPYDTPGLDTPGLERPARVDSPPESWFSQRGISPIDIRHESGRSWLAEPASVPPAYDPTGRGNADPFRLGSPAPGDPFSTPAGLNAAGVPPYSGASVGDELEYGRPYSGQPLHGWSNGTEPSPPRFDPLYTDPPTGAYFAEPPPTTLRLERPATPRRPATAPRSRSRSRSAPSARFARFARGRRRSLELVGVVLLSALAIGGTGVGVSRLLVDDPDAKQASTSAGAAAAPASAAPTPARTPARSSSMLSSRSTDPRPLAVAELGGPTYTGRGGKYVRTGTNGARGCSAAVDPSAAPLLATLGCSQAVSATVVNGGKGCVVTFGALNMPDEVAAGKLVDAMRDGRRGSFVPRRHGKAAEGSAGGPKSTWWFLMQPHGHWVTFATGAYASGKRVPPRDATIVGCDTDLLRQVQRTLDSRAKR